MKASPIQQGLLSMAIESVRKSGGLGPFWRQYNELRRQGKMPLCRAEVKELVVEYNSYIFRKAGGVKLNSDPRCLNMENAHFSGAGIREGTPLDGMLLNAIDKHPLIDEIPNYMDLLLSGDPKSPTGWERQFPDKVYLIEYEIAIGEDYIQPLFKVIARYHSTLQLYIVGRDRHTREPFALGIPNGFVQQSIQTCLRWTMNIHKGDEITEV